MKGQHNVDYSRTYMRGYNAGAKKEWPEHRPPAPPDENVRELVIAAQELRDAADNICAVLDEDDEWAKILAPKIDAVDRVMERWTVWLKGASVSDAPQGEQS